MDIYKVFIWGMLIGVAVELFLMYLHEAITKKPLKIHHSFHLLQKISLISIPLWGVFALIVVNDNKHLQLFLYAAAIGPLIELLAGRTFHRIFGIKLWSYKYGALGGGYTSIYAIPYWGGAALLFTLLARLTGI